MKREELEAAERLIWRRVLTESHLVEGFEVVRNHGQPYERFEVEVTRDGIGSLSWLDEDGLTDSLESVTVGLPKAGAIPLALNYKDHRTEPVVLNMVAMSNYSRLWYPISQLKQWPGDVLVADEEVETILKCEVDFYSILTYDKKHQRFRVLAFRYDEQPLSEIFGLYLQMRELETQWKFFHPMSVKERNSFPRLDKDEPLDRKPDSELLLTHYIYSPARALPRADTRLYQRHWVHRLVNYNDPIPYARDIPPEEV